MPVNVFRVGNFSHTHERQAFRQLVDSLRRTISEETVWVVGNAKLPRVTYRYPNSDRTRDYEGVNPDVIIFKHGAIAVVEMKYCPGIISFPTDKEEMWGDWTCDYEGQHIIINEGRASPLSQINDNRKALIAFLDQYEEDFSDEETHGSLWYKTSNIVLFTGSGSSFAHDKPSFWINTYLATIENDDPRYDLSKIVDDLTTPSRKYSQDNRSEITLTDSGIKKIFGLLNAKEIGVKPEKVADEQEGHILSAGYGYATIIANTSHHVVAREPVQKEILAPEGIEKEPLQIKLVKYYARCLFEEGKLSTQLDLSRINYMYPVERIKEPIFVGEGTFQMDMGRIPHSFLRANAQLTYGYFFLVKSEEYGGKNYYKGEPFFITDVRIETEEDQHLCSPIVEGELLINRRALRNLKKFADLSHEELEEYISEVEQIDELQERISKITSDIGIGNLQNYVQLGEFQVNRLSEGLLPAAIVFESSGSYYINTIAELERIADNWKERITKSEPITDFAWKFIGGISRDNLNQEWQPTPLSIVESNYDQSQATGLSLLDSNQLQVVSGPPGTGKSQVIQNIVANASISGISVLIASRNNKAVDVVVDRLNERIMKFPFILRTGNKEQNERMLGKLQNVRTTKPKENEGRQYILNKTRVGKINNESYSLDREYKKYLWAMERFKAIEGNFDNIRYQHEDLFFMTDWYCTQAEDFGHGLWQLLFDRYKRYMAKSDRLVGRLGVVLESGMSFIEIFSKSLFRTTVENIFLEDLKSGLTTQTLEILGETDLITASEDKLPVLGTLLELNKELDSIQRILNEVSEDDLLDSWEKLERSKLEYSRLMLDFEWRRRNDARTVKAAQDLLIRRKPDTNVFSTALSGFPCSATTSLSVARNAPLIANLFDLVVIDEASQSDMASIIPILYRGKRAVIIGDEMQLRPVIILDKEFDRETAKTFSLSPSEYETFGYSNTPALDLANDRFTRAGGRRLLLRNHYRSHPHIIQFSNHWFYDDSLRIRTQADNEKAVIWHNVIGKAKPRWTNPEEISTVVGIVMQLLNEGVSRERIGVVTPFRMQANSITSALRNRDLFLGDDGSITVDTAHGFQGDERLVMILSFAIGPEMPKGTILWVHDPGTYSKNLLNVALTRAQRQLHIVGNRELCRDSGGYLKHLVDYVDGISMET